MEDDGDAVEIISARNRNWTVISSHSAPFLYQDGDKKSARWK